MQKENTNNTFFTHVVLQLYYLYNDANCQKSSVGEGILYYKSESRIYTKIAVFQFSSGMRVGTVGWFGGQYWHGRRKHA